MNAAEEGSGVFTIDKWYLRQVQLGTGRPPRKGKKKVTRKLTWAGAAERENTSNG